MVSGSLITKQGILQFEEGSWTPRDVFSRVEGRSSCKSRCGQASTADKKKYLQKETTGSSIMKLHRLLFEGLVLLMTGVALGCVVRAVCWLRFYPNSHCIANKNGCLLRKALIPVAGWKFTKSVMCQLLWCSRGFDSEVHSLQLLYNICSKEKRAIFFRECWKKVELFFRLLVLRVYQETDILNTNSHDFPIILQEGKTLLPHACGWNNVFVVSVWRHIKLKKEM